MMGPTIKERHERWRKINDHRFPANMAELEQTSAGILVPGRHALFELMEDFSPIRYVDPAANQGGWQRHFSGTPTADLSVATERCGVAQMAPGATAGNNIFYGLEFNNQAANVLGVAVGKRAWLATRCKVPTANQNIVSVGCHTDASDPWGTEPADQFLFRGVASTPGNLEFACGTTNTTEVTVQLGAMPDDEYVRLLAFYDGADTVHAFRFDDTADQGLIASGSAHVTSSTQGDLLPGAAMIAGFGVEAIGTGAETFSIDYLYFATER